MRYIFINTIFLIIILIVFIVYKIKKNKLLKGGKLEIKVKNYNI